ncbi:MAG: NUDIX hydrolase [Erysipelotrichaceae bacterium]|nr:NUDIX hydrolase [Erysipelotrichaceae bacterium]MBQ1483599.1 NUDIX hydrolase [Erysipelotrichaceae bacterium]
MEKQVKREEIYEGKVIHVVKDQVALDDGSLAYREVVLHNGGACIALKKDGLYYMVCQYRYSLGKEMLEFPAGKIEKGEDPDETILREAVEETGYSVKNIRKMGSIIPTCGYCSERIHLYYGEADEKLGQHFDPDERIDLKRFSFAQIKEMIRDGRIDDAKTIALMFYLQAEGIDG